MGIPYDQWREYVKDRPDASELIAMHPQSPSRPGRFKGGTKGSWRITILSWHPATVNELMRSVKTRIRRKKADRVLIDTQSLHVPIATGPRRIHLAITLGKGRRAADPDAYWKSLLDALVACKLLIDDNRQNCVLDPVEFSRGNEPETTIELYDL